MVVPLRVMCPHSELVLGDAVELDFERQTRPGRDARRPRHRPLPRARGRPRLDLARPADPGPGRSRAGLQGPRRRDPPAQPRPAAARRRRCGRRRHAPRARADLRLRRRRLRGRRGAGRALRPRPRRAALLPEPPARTAALGAGRRGAEDPARDPDAARRLRGAAADQARRRDPRRHDARVGRGPRRAALDRRALPHPHARLDGRREGESDARAASACRWTSAAA